MRIALLGNLKPDYSTEHHHAQALEDLGHEVTRLQEGAVTADQIIDQARDADFLLWVHTHGWDTPGGIGTALAVLRRYHTTTVAYHLDLWHGLGREKDLQGGPYFSGLDHFFTVDPAMADWLNRNTDIHGHYLPAAVAHRECWMAPAAQRDLDVVFVGSHHYHPEWPYRNELIARLHARYGDRFHLIPGLGQPVRGAALNQLYGRTKVVVGDTLCPGFRYPGYWSDRVYETLGRGGMLIHPRIPGLDVQFRDGHDLVFYDYNDWSGLFDKIDHYLRFPVEREAIRHQGHAEVHRAHLYSHRWTTILETIT